MSRFFAFLILIIVLAITTFLGIVSLMSHGNTQSDTQVIIGVLAFSLLPAATVPLVYFLLFHGVFALNADHAWQGLSAGAYVIFLNLLVWLVWAVTVPAFNALGLRNYSGVFLLISLLITQVGMLVHFHRKIFRWLSERKKTGC